MTADDARKIAADNHHRTPLVVTDALRTMANTVEQMADALRSQPNSQICADALALAESAPKGTP